MESKTKNRNWLKNEISFLEQNYKFMSDKEMANCLGKTASSVEHKRLNLGLFKNKKKEMPLEVEEEILKSDLTYEQIALKYGYTYEEVRWIFRKNGKIPLYIHHRRRWTEEEDVYLKENYLNKGDKEIGEILNRSEIGVLKRRVKLNLHRKEFHIIETKPEKQWKDYEINFLHDNFDKMTYSEIGKHLNRTNKAVNIKATKLGLPMSGSKWSKMEDSLLEENRNLSLEEVSFLLNRSVKSIKHRYDHLGIKCSDPNHRTTLEIKIENILNELEIEFKTQRVLGKDYNFRADFVIEKIVIEAHGDYWHANPKVYPNPSPQQQIAILKDKIKKEYFESIGYKVYEIWESEVNGNVRKVKESIARLVGNH